MGLLGPLVLQAVVPFTAHTVTQADWNFSLSKAVTTRPLVNKNPGNLRSSSLANAQRLYGAANVIGLDDQGHVQFATWAAGLSAVRQDVRVKVSGRSFTRLPANPTILAFSAVYAEDPGHAAKLAALLHTKSMARIGIDVQEEAFLRALIRLEGGTDTWAAVEPLLRAGIT